MTPLVSMAEHLYQQGREFEFHVYARNASALPLHAELATRAWAARVHRHFSDDGDSFRASAPPALGAVDPQGAVYICGPAGFIDLALVRAAATGWPAERVVTERFSPPASTVDAGTVFDVIAADGGADDGGQG
ncbi:hypothetical protein ACIGCK_00340 [Microbacterium sp. NPDC078428]|uniref:hypothetical protein n=1 Tax=Microbacterium sp. NPDC078428 TaxID=3364190 RepID=UPI0037CC9F92